MMAFLPRRREDPTEYIDSYCHWDDALKRHLICSAFYFAKLKNEIVPSRYLGCWVIPDSIPRDMTAMAKYYAGERGIEDDHSGELYQWHDCPWCGGIAENIPAPRIAGTDE